MKVLIITTMPQAPEVFRIKEELTEFGHEAHVYSTKDFSFTKKGNTFKIPGLTDQNPDIIIVRGVLSQLKTIASYVKRMRERGIKVFDNNFLVSRYSISKVTDLVKLSLSGIEIPDTCYYKSFEDFYKAAMSLGYPLIVKSTRAGQGSGVFKADNEDELKKLIGDLEMSGKKPANYILQQFIDYEIDLRVLVIGKEIFCMRRIPREGDFRANFSLGGTVELFDLDEEGKELALKAMEAVGMSVAGVDILIDKSGKRYILEVNHTAGMKGMEEATGKNITKKYVEHILTEAK